MSLAQIKPNLLVALFLLTASSLDAQVPTNFTGVTTSIYNSNSLAPGYIFIASCGNPGAHGPFFLQMMNNDGSPYAFNQAGNITPGDDFYPYDFKVLANGLLLNAQYTTFFSYTDGGNVSDQILDENFNPVEIVQMGNGYQSESHDFELLPNGHVLMLGYYTTLADIRSVLPNTYPRSEVSGAIIQELDGNRSVVWQWRTWDHFNWSDFADWGSASSSLVAAWHVNAVRLDPIDGNLLVATTGEEMKIDRQTGNVLWRLGGAFNQFTFAGVTAQEAIRQLAGHDFHRLPNGNYILLNNGAANGSRTSQVHEYQLDEVHKVATHVWQYIPTNTIATWNRGNVQRLPNGNTFIGWGTSTSGQNPDCTEITSNGSKIFELSFTNTLTDSYRAFRFVYPPIVQRFEDTVRELADGNTYNFTNTGVSLVVGTRMGDGYNTATIAREPYAPLYPLFQTKAPRLLPVRVSFSQTFIQSLSGVIYFDPISFSIPDPNNTTVYYRNTEGQGVFVPLNSSYDPGTGQLAAELTDIGFGEYSFGFPDVAEIPYPPLLVEAESLQSSGFVTRVPPLVQSNKTYTVNQQLPIALSWCPKGFAAFYALQISTNPAFSTLEVDEPYVPEARYTFSNALPGKTYYWRVNTYNDGGLSDWATSTFSTVPPAIHVTSPNGGEIWRRGGSYFVQWDDNILENVTISLYKAGVLVKTITTNAASTVSYQFQPGLDLVPGADYSLRVSSATNSSLFDISDAPFSIIDVPIINPASVVRLPNGHLQFSVSAPGAATATVFASTNLSTWQSLQTLTITNGSAVFTDPSPAILPAHYYRLAIP
jgi:hypothetical protein